jgi:hypothetical protein
MPTDRVDAEDPPGGAVEPSRREENQITGNRTMTIRSIIADMLEAMATSLRAADAPTGRPPVAANDTGPRKRVVRRPRAKSEHAPHPEGFWLCTVSTFDDFLVGHAYPAIRDGSSVRVHPYRGSSWAPYWQFDDGRFCYPEHQLDFTYLGSEPAGHPVDTRTLQQRIDERTARRAA